MVFNTQHTYKIVALNLLCFSHGLIIAFGNRVAFVLFRDRINLNEKKE